MNAMLTIIKKEFKRIFTDRKLVISTFFVPGFMIYFVYSFLCFGLQSSQNPSDSRIPTILCVNSSSLLLDKIGSSDFNLIDAAEASSEMNEASGLMDSLKQQITDKEADLLLVFPENFDQEIAAFRENPDYIAQNVEIYYNTASKTSQYCYQTFVGALNLLEDDYANCIAVNQSSQSFDLSERKDLISGALCALLPMMLMMFLFSGCLGIAPMSLTGEKERGTLASLLITPISRMSIVSGKIISITVLSLLSSVSSILGILLSLPNMLAMDNTALDVSEISLGDFYQIQDYLLLIVVIVSTVLTIVAVVSVISMYADTMQTASSMCSPLMMIASFAGMVTLLDMDFSGILWKLIPFFNCTLCLNEIFSFQAVPADILVTCITNLVYTAALLILLGKMFQDERITNQ